MPVKNGTRTPKQTRQSTKIAQRRRESLELRNAGLTYAEIAEHTGVSTKQAWDDVRTAIRDIPAEEAAIARTIETNRIDKLFRKSYTEALRGDWRAMEQAGKMIDRRIKLLGLETTTDTGLAALREAVHAAFAITQPDTSENNATQP